MNKDDLGATRPSQRPPDWLDETQRGKQRDPLSEYQPIRIDRDQRRKQRRRQQRGCGSLLAILILLSLYLFFPGTESILVLGIDRTTEGNVIGRSDTIIALRVNPLAGRISLLSIPRDLWVTIPGWGENRINTAHFFGEANLAGSGPQTAMDTVTANFGIESDHYVRLQLERFPAVIDALGGITVDLPFKMGGLSKGKHHLNGDEALAFVRDRSVDDFERMRQGQVFARDLFKTFLNPLKWLRMPFFLAALNDAVDTDLSLWIWPRLGVAAARAALFGNLEHFFIERSMTTPYLTGDGANVLLPRWDLIYPEVNNFLSH